ncbi:MAG: ABC transporter ATP-binding protein [Saccharospirillaceae bacterium]|nr:ABC transporter ATP-binding protein [Pseudomonadales bacterium]NRB78328.1 ABC transporter ATP-binding protein [Saccharospirillaceae bacterium]
MNNIIEIHNLSKSYKHDIVLINLSLTIKQGQIVGLLGRNGAGKSTLLESIMGLKDIDNNCVHIWQQTMDELDDDKRNLIAFVPQNSSGFEWMKVGQYLDYFAGFFNNWDKEYAEELVSRWFLTRTKRIADLSGGQKQILQIIQALSAKPELLILDEPVASLDPNMRREFLSEIIKLACDQNITVLFSTHIISDLERIVSHIALLKNGCIEIFEELESIKENASSLIISGKIQNKENLKHLVNWQDFENGQKAICVTAGQQSIVEIEQQHDVLIKVTPLSLEDWYLEVTCE